MKLRRTARRFHRAPRLAWIAEEEFRIDDVADACRLFTDLFPSTGERFCLRKPHAEKLCS
jgi:hypothetical protein